MACSARHPPRSSGCYPTATAETDQMSRPRPGVFPAQRRAGARRTPRVRPSTSRREPRNPLHPLRAPRTCLAALLCRDGSFPPTPTPATSPMDPRRPTWGVRQPDTPRARCWVTGRWAGRCEPRRRVCPALLASTQRPARTQAPDSMSCCPPSEPPAC